MALIITEGIVLRTVKYSDNTVISSILTPANGVVSVIASKGSKSSSAMMNYLRVMNILTLTLYPSKNNGIHRVKEVNFAYLFQHLNIDVVRSVYGCVITETVQAIHGVNTSEADVLFRFLKEYLTDLDRCDSYHLHMIIQGLISLLALEGITPYNNYSEINCYFNLRDGLFQERFADRHTTLDQSSSAPIALVLDGHENTLTEHQLTEIMDHLYVYLCHHIPEFKTPRSWIVLKEMAI